MILHTKYTKRRLNDSTAHGQAGIIGFTASACMYAGSMLGVLIGQKIVTHDEAFADEGGTRNLTKSVVLQRQF